MIPINFTQFQLSKRLSIGEIQKKTGIVLQTIYNIKRRSSVKPQTLRILEKHYPTIKNFLEGDSK